MLKNELLERTMEGSHAIRTRMCLSGGAKRGHAPRLSELKIAIEGDFQQTASSVRITGDANLVYTRY